jgi:uncharacterized protein (TIGR00266 family)
MDIKLKHQPAFSLAILTLSGNEQVKVEPGAMVSYSDGVTVETKAEGGLMGGLKRMVGGESFFQNTYKAPGQGGEVTAAPSLPGDMITINIGGSAFMLKSGAYVACEMGVVMDTKWGGAKGFFGGGSLLLLKCTGTGKLIAASYGAIEERTLGPSQKYTVDTDHIVGFDESIGFNVKRVGGWKSTLLSGEGLVCELTGPGRVLMQSRSEGAFLGWLIPKLPKSSN